MYSQVGAGFQDYRLQHLQSGFSQKGFKHQNGYLLFGVSESESMPRENKLEISRRWVWTLFRKRGTSLEMDAVFEGCVFRMGLGSASKNGVFEEAVSGPQVDLVTWPEMLSPQDESICLFCFPATFRSDFLVKVESPKVPWFQPIRESLFLFNFKIQPVSFGWKTWLRMHFRPETASTCAETQRMWHSFFAIRGREKSSEDSIAKSWCMVHFVIPALGFKLEAQELLFDFQFEASRWTSWLGSFSLETEMWSSIGVQYM